MPSRGGKRGELAVTSARSAPWRTISRRRARRDEQQGVDDDGLTGAGLAGQRGEAGVKLELRLIDQHQGRAIEDA